MTRLPRTCRRCSRIMKECDCWKLMANWPRKTLTRTIGKWRQHKADEAVLSNIAVLLLNLHPMGRWMGHNHRTCALLVDLKESRGNQKRTPFHLLHHCYLHLERVVIHHKSSVPSLVSERRGCPCPCLIQASLMGESTNTVRSGACKKKKYEI